MMSKEKLEMAEIARKAWKLIMAEKDERERKEKEFRENLEKSGECNHVLGINASCWGTEGVFEAFDYLVKKKFYTGPNFTCVKEEFKYCPKCGESIKEWKKKHKVKWNFCDGEKR
jgi:hypothetical protein